MLTCQHKVHLLDEVGPRAAVEVAGLSYVLSFLVVAKGSVVSLSESVHSRLIINLIILKQV
jgi:hypothetical protein